MTTRNLFCFVSLLPLALTACSGKLDIAQHGVLNYDTYYNTDEQVETAATAMYLDVQSWGWEYNIQLCKNMLTDDFYAGGSARGDNTDLEHLNEFTFDAEQDYVQNIFTTQYSLIYHANVVLGHVDPEGSAIAKRSRAEAKVFRAFAYFDLISMWGNPPVVDHELAPSEYSRPNGSSEELWNLVVTDLTEAIESGFLPEKSSVNDRSVWRVTKQVAQALLGKAYLWMAADLSDNSYYAKAAEQFDAVVSSGKYDLFAGEYGDMRRNANKRNCEYMFWANRIYDEANAYTYNFSLFHIMMNWRMDKMNWPSDTPVMNTGWGFCVPTKDLYDAFVAEEGADGYRLNQTLKTLDYLQSEMGITLKEPIISEGFFNWKLRVLKEDRGPDSDYYYDLDPLFMRYAEVLLCGAEAHLMAGNGDKAAQYLNKVRTRARLPEKAAVTLEDIKTEKRLELCGEGQRFQDLLRWGDAAAKMADNGKTYPRLLVNGQVTYESCGNPVYGFKAGKHEHLPYPATEIRLNHEITQNPGY